MIKKLATSVVDLVVGIRFSRNLNERTGSRRLKTQYLREPIALKKVLALSKTFILRHCLLTFPTIAVCIDIASCNFAPLRKICSSRILLTQPDSGSEWVQSSFNWMCVCLSVTLLQKLYLKSYCELDKTILGRDWPLREFWFSFLKSPLNPFGSSLEPFENLFAL